MKKLVACLALVSLLGLGGQAFATIVANDDVPAATLLLPYFETQYNNPSGLNTLFSINNASAAPALAHVTLWTDESVPTLDFDVYLTGYDVVTINLRDIFNGIIPQTADDARDGGDTISPQGPISGDITYPNCGNFPLGNLTAGLVAHIQAAHTGNSSTVLNACAGYDYGDGVADLNATARGYITVDSTNQCSLLFPSSPGYFIAGGAGVANNRNVLWGDYFYVDEANNFAQGESLVHIEACGDPPGSTNGAGQQTAPGASVGDESSCPFVAGDYTFYGRYVAGAATDGREPLVNTWATRYISGGLFTGGTQLVVWRDSKSISNLTGFACGTNAAWFPLNQNQVVAFNEQEDATELCFTGDKFSPPTGGADTCFPLEAARYTVGVSPLDPPYSFGWMYLNLGFTLGVGANAGIYDGIAQNWVTTVMDADGRFSVGYDAIMLDNASTYNGVGGQGPILPSP